MAGRGGRVAFVALVAALLGVLAFPPASSAAPRALLVGTYNGIHGSFKTIQSAAGAGPPGDWHPLGPGACPGRGGTGAGGAAGVLVRAPWTHLRGMDRNTVIGGGTKRGAKPCSKRPQDQQ